MEQNRYTTAVQSSAETSVPEFDRLRDTVTHKLCSTIPPVIRVSYFSLGASKLPVASTPRRVHALPVDDRAGAWRPSLLRDDGNRIDLDEEIRMGQPGDEQHRD
jgi:hypothetical protein